MSDSSLVDSLEWLVSRASRLHIALLSAFAITASAAPAIKVDPHEALANQIAAERATLATTLATVGDKLHTADNVRLHRLHAALRVLHAPLAENATDDERMAVARRRAAARLLLERDHDERTILADETAHLRAADAATSAAEQKVPTVALPATIDAPAKGTIARHFGEYQHERSKATLSRRGVDFEVEDHAPAVAPADGIVRYAGPIRGLDHGVILDHGDYLTVIAKLGELTLPVGTHVSRGDRLGRAAHHRVYLEVRAKIGRAAFRSIPSRYFRAATERDRSRVMLAGCRASLGSSQEPSSQRRCGQGRARSLSPRTRRGFARSMRSRSRCR